MADTTTTENFYIIPRASLRDRVNAAHGVEGTVHENALMRGRLAEFIDTHPDDIDTLIKCVRVIIRGVAEDYRMRPRDVAALSDAAIATVRDLATMFSKPPEETDV